MVPLHGCGAENSGKRQVSIHKCIMQLRPVCDPKCIESMHIFQSKMIKN